MINKSIVVDPIVLQDFHLSNKNSLVASTRPEAIALKQQYSWWYKDEQASYQQFKERLATQLQEAIPLIRFY